MLTSVSNSATLLISSLVLKSGELLYIKLFVYFIISNKFQKLNTNKLKLIQVYLYF